MKTFQTLLAVIAVSLAVVHADETAVNGTSAKLTTPRVTCANVRCMSGTTCVMKQVQCVRAPCPMSPACVPNRATPTQSTGACTPGFCPDSETCELKQVQCVAAPCDPQPTCVPQKTTTQNCPKQCGATQRCYLYNAQPYCADVCTASRCAKNERCVLQPAQCLVAPCPRVATCLPA